MEQEIIDVGNFIEDTEKLGKKVYILDATSAIFMIPIDRYNKDFDMFLLGNLGDKNQLSQELENEENLVVLIAYSEDLLNWQHPKDITDPIIENWTNVGKVTRFYAYIKQ